MNCSKLYENHLFDSLVNAILALLNALKASWTTQQKQIIHLRRKGLTYSEIGKLIEPLNKQTKGISKQAVYNSLKSAKWSSVSFAIDTLNDKIITELGPTLFDLIFPKEICDKYLNKPNDVPLMFIPHKELYSIPWEILKNSSSEGKFGGYLGLEFQIVRNFSLDLARIMLKKGEAKKGKSILLLGNPTEDLDGASLEVETLNKTLGAKTDIFKEKEQIELDPFSRWNSVN